MRAGPLPPTRALRLVLPAAAIACFLAVAGRGLGEPTSLASLDHDESSDKVWRRSSGPARLRQEYPAVHSHGEPRAWQRHTRGSAVVQQMQSQDGGTQEWRTSWIFGPPLKVARAAHPAVSPPRAGSQRTPAGSNAATEPAIVYMPGAAGTATMKESSNSIGEAPNPVGYVFLPDMSARPGPKAQQQLEQQQLAAPAVPGTVDDPEYERKFLPFLPCWVWGGDQVVCTSPNGKHMCQICQAVAVCKAPCLQR